MKNEEWEVMVLRDRRGLYRLSVILIILVACGTSWAQDEFDGLKCGNDIAKALIGKRGSNAPVAAIELRHKDLGLKNLGGTEISDRLFLASWQICGSEYELLVNTATKLVRDVIAFPAHSAASPMFIGACGGAGEASPDTLVAVLNNRGRSDARDEKMAMSRLKATAAWRIDTSKERFVTLPTEKLMCPLGGIVTQDGGP